MLFLSLTTSIALLTARTSATIFYAGVAEAGGEFGVWSMRIVAFTMNSC